MDDSGYKAGGNGEGKRSDRQAIVERVEGAGNGLAGGHRVEGVVLELPPVAQEALRGGGCVSHELGSRRGEASGMGQKGGGGKAPY